MMLRYVASAETRASLISITSLARLVSVRVDPDPRPSASRNKFWASLGPSSGRSVGSTEGSRKMRPDAWADRGRDRGGEGVNLCSDGDDRGRDRGGEGAQSWPDGGCWDRVEKGPGRAGLKEHGPEVQVKHLADWRRIKHRMPRSSRSRR